MQELTPDMSVKSPEETVMGQHMIKDIHDLLRGLDSRERQALFLVLRTISLIHLRNLGGIFV